VRQVGVPPLKEDGEVRFGAYYKVLPGGFIEKCRDINEYVAAFGAGDKEMKPFMDGGRLVAKSDVPQIVDGVPTGEEALVSTVFLCSDHGWQDPYPVLFETMIFGIEGADGEYQERAVTLDEALYQHRLATRHVLSKSPLPEEEPEVTATEPAGFRAAINKGVDPTAFGAYADWLEEHDRWEEAKYWRLAGAEGLFPASLRASTKAWEWFSVRYNLPDANIPDCCKLPDELIHHDEPLHHDEMWMTVWPDPFGALEALVGRMIEVGYKGAGK
jgi:uncharacterized protein (TIGR02996 family)